MELELTPEQKKLENEVYTCLKNNIPPQLEDERLTHIEGDGPVCRQFVRKLGQDRLDEGILVFHAGTKTGEQGQISTSAGRVLTVVATGKTVAEARSKVHLNLPASTSRVAIIVRTSPPGSYCREWQKLGFDTTFNRNSEGELWH